jgi:hypothetical protein
LISLEISKSDRQEGLEDEKNAEAFFKRFGRPRQNQGESGLEIPGLCDGLVQEAPITFILLTGHPDNRYLRHKGTTRAIALQNAHE